MLLLVRIRVVRFGTDRWREGEIEAMRLLARRRVRRRFKRGRLARATMELSVRSMASC